MEDGPYCASGNVPVTSDYSAISMIGFNVNQERIDDAPVGSLVPSGDGLLVNISNNANTDVIRVQIQGPNGATDENDRWCAPVSQFNQDVIIPWDAFNTMCWDNSGAYYSGQSIVAALVFVPGMGSSDSNPQDRYFDMCVNDIGPDTGGGGSGGGTSTACNNSSTIAYRELSGQYDRVQSTDGRYIVQNNVWGGGSQTIAVNGVAFDVISQSGSASGGSPLSFPSAFIGSNGDASTSGSNLPRQVSAISSIPTCLGWSPGSGQYNIAYDVWFNPSNYNSNPPDRYLMVWLHDPSNYQPGGQQMSNVNLGGETWAVWYGDNGQGHNVVSYVHNGGDLAAGAAYNFDLKNFIDDAVGRGYIQSSSYLISIQAGIEIWSGGVGTSIDGFSAQVN